MAQGVPEGVVSWGRMVVWRRGDSARLLYPGVIDAGSGPPEASVDVGAESEVAIQPRSLERRVLRTAWPVQGDCGTAARLRSAWSPREEASHWYCLEAACTGEFVTRK